VKIALMDGTALLFVPAPQTAYDDSRPVERVFIQSPPQAVDEATVEARLAKEINFDPDVWIVEIEDRAGRFPRPCENLATQPVARRELCPDWVAGRVCDGAERARWRSSS
jgi:hypothetical protein